MAKKKILRIVIAAILLLTAGIYLISIFNNSSNFLNNYVEPKASAPVFSASPIAVVGDLQRTSIYEELIGREQNDVERKKILSAIADENPAELIILGDMIFDGSDNKEWIAFDSLLAPINKKEIPIFPVVGNHEYWGNNSTAMRNLNKQFKMLTTSHWYTDVYDSVALIFLDSNESDLTETGWKLEHDWLNKVVSQFDTSSAIKGIIMFDHHPPFTNSLITGDEINVQNNFLPAYYRSNKTLLFVSGHAHTYEHFNIKGKDFIVSGGGGGPRVKLRTGIGAHKDLYKGDSPRPFNYLLIVTVDNGIKVTVKGLDKGSSKFFKMDEFVINFNEDKKSNPF